MLWVSEETPEQTLFAQAHRQAVDLCEALDYMRFQGQELIDRHQLNRLVDQVAGAGGSLSDRFAEVMHVPAADSPADGRRLSGGIFPCPSCRTDTPGQKPSFRRSKIAVSICNPPMIV